MYDSLQENSTSCIILLQRKLCLQRSVAENELKVLDFTCKSPSNMLSR